MENSNLNIAFGTREFTLFLASRLQIPKTAIHCNLDAYECSYFYFWFNWESLKIPRDMR